MSEIYSLQDFALAKQMVEEIPKALEALEEAGKMLYPHRGFAAVVDTLFSIESSIIILGTRLPYFQTIVDNKGETK